VPYTLWLAVNLVVSEAEQTITGISQSCIACPIILDLKIVRLVINFDDQHAFEANEVDIVRADRPLAAEFVSAKPAITK